MYTILVQSVQSTGKTAEKSRMKRNFKTKMLCCTDGKKAKGKRQGSHHFSPSVVPHFIRVHTQYGQNEAR